MTAEAWKGDPVKEALIMRIRKQYEMLKKNFTERFARWELIFDVNIEGKAIRILLTDGWNRIALQVTSEALQKGVYEQIAESLANQVMHD